MALSLLDNLATYGTQRTRINAGLTEVNNLTTLPKAAAYITASAPTTLTTAGTYYPVLGTFANYVFSGFFSAETYIPGIQYTDSRTLSFEVDWHATYTASAVNTQVQGAILKNGVYVAGSGMGTLLKTAGEEYSLGGTCVVELETGDEIQIVVKSESDGDVVTAAHYTTTIRVF